MKTYLLLSAVVALACALPRFEHSRASFYRTKRVAVANESTTVIKGDEVCHVPKTARIACGSQGNTTYDFCQSIGCCWDPVERRNGVPQCYVNAVEKSYFQWNVYKSRAYYKYNLCSSAAGEDIHLDDFTKDGSPDLFCRSKLDTGHNTTIDFYSGQEGYSFPHEDRFVGLTDFCKEDGDRFLTADVNNDQMADVVCVSANGAVEARVSFFEDSVGLPIDFTEDAFYDESFQFCIKPKSKIFVGDFDGNSLPDLLCVCKDDSCAGQRRQLAKGDGTGGYLAPITDPNFDDFCIGENDRILVADFDSDVRDDLICQKPAGEYQIGLTDGDGLLVNEDWHEKEGWCSQSGDRFYVGYFNDDGRADLMCHNADKTICLRYNSHIYRNADMFDKNFCTPETWCESGEITVSDYNGDALDDVFCIEADGNFKVSITKLSVAIVEFVQIDYPYITDKSQMDRFCANRDIYVLDANGDSKQDLLCHDSKAGIIKLVYGDNFGHPKLTTPYRDEGLHYCHRNNYYPEYPTLLVTDQNGDGLTDLVCHSAVDGSVTSVLAESGYAPAYRARQWNQRLSDLASSTFCMGVGKTVHTGDINADGKGDLICRDQADGTLSFMKSNGPSFASSVAVRQENFCPGLDGQILIGNFNQDIRQDVMCQNRTSGTAKFLLATSVFGKFEQETYVSDSEFCGSIDDEGGNVHVGDYNGDMLFDIMCHYPDGSVKIKYNLGIRQGNSIEFGDDWGITMPICEGYGRKLEVYDANGDDLWDMTCTYSSGLVYIAEGHIIEGESFVVSNVTTSDGNKK